MRSFEIILQVGLLSLVALWYGAIAKDTNYCDLCEDHIFCRFKDVINHCGDLIMRGVTEEDKGSIVEKLNMLRSKVASGKEQRGSPGPQPQAANMRALRWDAELAGMAQLWAQRCDAQVASCLESPRFSVSQVGWWLQSEVGQASNSGWLDVVDNWYRNVDSFNYSSVESFRFDVNIGMYSVLTWADTSLVGCGYINYIDDRLFNTHLYICNFGQAGNHEHQPVYLIGRPCSKCPNGTTCDERYSGLCH